MTPKKKNHTLTAVFLLLTLIAFLLGLWPFMVLATPFVLIYFLCRMAAQSKKPAAAVTVQPPALPKPATERSMLAIAFGVLQQRITEAVQYSYPTARWTWAMGNAQEHFAAGEPLSIMLNGAGGYRRALVRTHNLQFCGLVYQLSPNVPRGTGIDPGEEPEPEEQTPDYGLLAFEWVDANLQHLNTQGNESIANGQTGFRIPADELPHGDSWPAICTELVRCGFAAADVLADGIQVQIKSKEGA